MSDECATTRRAAPSASTRPDTAGRIRVLVLTRYGRLGASSRLRFLQYLPLFEMLGLDCTVSPLFDDATLRARYERGGYSISALLGSYWQRLQMLLRKRRYDVLWIEKEALPWWPASMERFLLSGVPYVLDLDDAIFHNYDLHRRPWVQRMFARRIDYLMAGAHRVVAGNAYLGLRARQAGACRIETLPTVIDLERYPAPVWQCAVDELPRVVWIGSPSTVKYLQQLGEPLAELNGRCRFVLRVIGAGPFEMPGVEVESVTWNESTEVASIAECDIGIMPLVDSPWERGKCGYKLIQYMACGLPVVASPVGANVDIVEDRATGFLAAQPQDWVAHLEHLLRDPGLRRRMGMSGRKWVETDFSLQARHRRMATLLKEATR